MKIEERNIPELIKKGKGNEVISHLYKLLFPKVRNYILRQHGRKEDSSDVFQDALLYFYKQVMDNSYNDKYTVYGYIYKLCINRWINKIKRDQKMVLSSEMIENYDEKIDNNFGEIDELFNSRSQIESILETIGDKCKEILMSTIAYDLMIEDIVIRMGFISEGAAKMQIKRCKEKLYKIVKENPQIIKKLIRE